MGKQGELSPYEARDAADLIESMQRLKERSGLTYRELEERAARNGDVLARSTLADTLKRTTLPSPDVLAGFVRACGDGQRADAWLDARNRIAALSAPDTRPRTGESTRPRIRRVRGRAVALAAALLVPLVPLAAWQLLPDSSGDPGSGAAPADGWVTIRPALLPDLCLTEGRDRDGAYGSAVAVQLPCADATVPRTNLEPTGERLYRIQWHHPREGKGCLTIMSSGPVRGMLEPRNNCAQGTLFRLEPTAGDSAGGFRLRPVGSSRCVGIADNGSAEGAEAVEEPCTGAADQRFLVRAG